MLGVRRVVLIPVAASIPRRRNSAREETRGLRRLQVHMPREAMAEHGDGDPISYRSVAPGTPVYAADGERLGTVVRVLEHESEQMFDGLVAAIGGEHRFVDAPDVSRCAERAVRPGGGT